MIERDPESWGGDDWLEFSSKKLGADAARTALELREASRQAAAYPDATVRVGGDAHAPRHPTAPEQTLPSFDLSVERSGQVVASIEVTSIESPVAWSDTIMSGIRHAEEKVVARARAGSPIAGDCVATVNIKLARSVNQQRRGRVEISSKGDRVRVTGRIPPPTTSRC